MRFLKFIFRMVLVLLLAALLMIGGFYGYVRWRMHEDNMPYTETVERIIMDMIPDEGITVQGRNYNSFSMLKFLEEIRWDPYNYIHKDHHCVLQYVSQDKIYWIVTGLRVVLGVGHIW